MKWCYCLSCIVQPKPLVSSNTGFKSAWCCVSRTSVYNRAEADFIVMLCSHLGVYFGPKKILNNIGIITPYRRQQRILKDQLAHRFNFSQWSCNTYRLLSLCNVAQSSRWYNAVLRSRWVTAKGGATNFIISSASLVSFVADITLQNTEQLVN